MSKITSALIFVSVAVILWSASFSLSAYLSKQSLHSKQKQPQQNDSDSELEKLRQVAISNPNSVEAHFQLAKLLYQRAFQDSNGTILMESVKEYTRVLELDEKNPAALLTLADICVQTGILDKAEGYYSRYLAIYPEDRKIQTEYALVLLQNSKAEEGRKILQELLKATPEFFEANLALAVLEKVVGNESASQKQAELARQYAPDDEARLRVNEFISGVTNSSPPQVEEQRESTSIAGKINNFFRNHSIVGPKIKQINWPELNAVEIVLEDFPVEHMPTFAKEKFTQGIKEHFSSVSEKISIRIVDQQTGKVLMSIVVGDG